MSGALQLYGVQEDIRMTQLHYQYCGVVREVADFRRIKAMFMLDFVTDVIVARYHPEGKNRRIQKITDIFHLLTEAKRKGERGDAGKRIFIYRQR